MKIRNGFVSNSSSSSFVVIGYEIELSDIEQQLKNGNKVLIKHSLDELIVIKLDKKMYSYLKKHPEFLETIDTAFVYSDVITDQSDNVDVPVAPNADYKLHIFTASEHTFSDLDGLKWYVKDCGYKR